MVDSRWSNVTPAVRLKFAENAWGWKPHVGQVRTVLDESRSKVIVCGRRWGKTQSGAIDDVSSLILKRGWGCMVIAPSRDQVMINYKEAKGLLEAIPDMAGKFKCKETPHPEITLAGSEIVYRTAGEDGKYIRGHGKTVHRIRIDEAAYVKQSIVELVVEPMRLDHGAELILQGTPFGKNWYYARYCEGLKDDSHYVPGCSSHHFPTWTNPHLHNDELLQIRSRLGADSLQWKSEYCGEFVDTAGSVFPFDLIQGCFYDPDPSVEYARYVCGIDLARYSDYTVVSVAGHDRGMVNLVDMDRFNQDDWLIQKSRIYDTVHKYDAVGCIDATGSGDSIADDLIRGEFIGNEGGTIRKRDGLKLEPVRITSNAVKRELVDKLKLWMGKGMVKFPYPSKDLVTGEDKWNVFCDELKYYTFKLTESGRVTFQADSNYHDDCVMSLALLVRQAFGNFEKTESERAYPYNSWGAVCQEIDEAQKNAGRMIITA